MPGLALGAVRSLDGAGGSRLASIPAHHLVTHGVLVGSTGSGKTGLLTVTCEEALRSGVPVLLIDVKGDLPNLLLSFPTLDPEPIVPWVDGLTASDDDREPAVVARDLAQARARGLQSWGIGPAELAAFVDRTRIRVLTPGSTAGEPLHILSSLERRTDRWDTDPESAQASLSAAVSLVLRLLGRDADPARSREHVLLSVLAERRLRAGQTAAIEALLGDLASPPIDTVGALPVDDYVSRADRKALCAALNNLLASPTLAAWRRGATLDVGAWLAPAADDPRTPAVIVSVAHLDDAERALVLGVLLEEVLAWTRSLPGSHKLRALVVFDEVYGFLPPHPQNPPTKRPLVALLKQARAFGVGLLLATQNPMDLDYRALGNAGFWVVGRLQTEADRQRIVDGLTRGLDDRRAAATLATLLSKLRPQWFVMRDAHAEDGPLLLQARYAMSLLRGPMTRTELARARAGRDGAGKVAGRRAA